jgi:hypothetical protein
MNERIDVERKTKVERYLGRACVRPPGKMSLGVLETICLRPLGVKSSRAQEQVCVRPPGRGQRHQKWKQHV